jgi:hypothetical protein
MPGASCTALVTTTRHCVRVEKLTEHRVSTCISIYSACTYLISPSKSLIETCVVQGHAVNQCTTTHGAFMICHLLVLPRLILDLNHRLLSSHEFKETDMNSKHLWKIEGSETCLDTSISNMRLILKDASASCHLRHQAHRHCQLQAAYPLKQLP